VSEFVEVAPLEQVPVGTGTSFVVGDTPIAVFNVGGTIYAMSDACLHRGSSLGAGKLEGNVVTCRAHGWRYNVTTGSTVHVPGYGVASYAAKVIDGKIWVSVS